MASGRNSEGNQLSKGREPSSGSEVGATVPGELSGNSNIVHVVDALSFKGVRSRGHGVSLFNRQHCQGIEVVGDDPDLGED
ncbi:conserved hypothetical protein [Ricinus communis]|uniref:Uncharacterized protein n=1 Tax=Ricinus communis TaxID=3988 RepID=B9SHE0_RICCO|nr:conserved hypothetical protein [Ricinus communis]